MSTQLSKAYTKNGDAADDIEAPEELPGDELPDEEEPPKNSRGIFLYIVIGIALGMISLYSISMAVISGTILAAAGIVSILVGGTVVVAEVIMSKMDSTY